MHQTTLSSTVKLSGKGLHTGAPATIHLHPAEVNTGYRFKRADLDGVEPFHATANLVQRTHRGTQIGPADHTVSTVEHLLSALRGLEVDNVLIEIDGPEVPIMGGSAGAFVDAITKAGLIEQDQKRNYLEISEKVEYKDEETGAEYILLPSDHLEVTVMIDFNSPVLGQQYAHLSDLSSYASDIAPCRTFVFLRELETLLDHGLIKGGDLDNAVVIADRKMSTEDLSRLAERLGRPSIGVVEEGILNTTDLVFKNEPARHKLLDVIGDLALVGAPIKGRIIATKPGHTSNVRLAKHLRELHKKQIKLAGIPQYDPTSTPVKDVNAIMAMLPHRYPFLMIDKIIELSDQHVVGIKNVTMNENFFQGHFPDNPVFPGVLQMEALAQTGGILALSTVPDPENWDTYFLKIDNAKFKMKVLPGDTIVLKMELLSPIRRGICHMQGVAYVNGKVASQGELTAQIVRRS